MIDLMLGLHSRTAPGWARVALSDEIELLRDHAHLERKAAGHVITLMGQVPAAAARLLEVAREELGHFERVQGLLRGRGADIGPDRGNPYVKRVARIAGETVLDRLLRMGLIEARSYERFCLLSEAAEGELRDLFRSLRDSEAGHHALFLKLAHEISPRDEVTARWAALAEGEAAIVAALPWGARIH